jgi:hypothetical protein
MCFKNGFTPNNLFNYFIGVALALMMLNGSKGNIAVYDEVKNRTQIIGNIPNPIVAILGSINLIQRTLVDIISVSGDPIGYQQSAGGVGPKALYETAASNLSKHIPSRYDHQSVMAYIDDCVIYDMFVPGTGIDQNKIFKDTANLVDDLLAPANSPAIFTALYSQSNPQGETKSCQEAWTSLSTFFNTSSNFDPMIKKICTSAGYNASNADEYDFCRNTIIPAYIAQSTGESGIASDQLVKQTYIGQVFLQAASNGDTEVLTAYNFGVGAQGAEVYSQKFIPIIMALVTAISISVVPFLFLFLPTLLWWKVLSFSIALMAFPAIWNVVDAILHGYIVERSNEIYAEVKANRLGLDALTSLTGSSMDVLNMWWYMRAIGMGIAMTISGAFFTASYAASSLVSGLASSGMGAGAKGATDTIDVRGQGAAIGATQSGIVTSGTYGKYGFDTVGAEMLNRGRRVEGYLGQKRAGVTAEALGAMDSAKTAADLNAFQHMINAYGGFNSFIAKVGDANALSNLKSNSSIMNLADMISKATGKSHAESVMEAGRLASLGEVNKSFGELLQFIKKADALGMDTIKLAAFEKGGFVVTDNVADYLNEKLGTDQFHAGQQLQFNIDTNGNISNINTKENAADGSKVELTGGVGSNGKVNWTDKHVMGMVNGLRHDYHEDTQTGNRVGTWGVNNEDGSRTLHKTDASGATEETTTGTGGKLEGLTSITRKDASGKFIDEHVTGTSKDGLAQDYYRDNSTDKNIIKGTWGERNADGSITQYRRDASTTISATSQNKEQLKAYSDKNRSDHPIQSMAADEIASRLGENESAIVTEIRDNNNNLISSNILHGVDADLKGGGGKSITIKDGQMVIGDTVTDKNRSALAKELSDKKYIDKNGVNQFKNAIEGMKNGDAYVMTKGANGTITGFKTGVEAEAHHKDMAIDEQGEKSWKGQEKTTVGWSGEIAGEKIPWAIKKDLGGGFSTYIVTALINITC